jgi:hypothetical protein
MTKNKLAISKKDVIIAALFIGSLWIMDFSAWGQPGLKKFNGGIGMLDMKFYYGSAYALDMMNRLGRDGIDFYIRLLCIDFLFIFSFAYIHVKLMFGFVSRFSLQPVWNRLAVLALARAFFDLAENVLLILALCNFPQTFDAIHIAGIVTSLKWCVLSANALIMIVILIVKFVLKGRRYRDETH